MTLTLEDKSEVDGIARMAAREEAELALKVSETNRLITGLIESSRIAHGKIGAIEANVTDLKSTQVEHGKMLESHGKMLESHGKMLESHGKMLEAIMRHLKIELNE